MPKAVDPPSYRALPDIARAAEIDEIAPGSGARLVEAYLQALETDDYERRAMVGLRIADASHARAYRHLCLFLGTTLASGAIALGAYAVAQGADVYAIAALVTPISGLAGIFVWGGQRQAIERQPRPPRNPVEPQAKNRDP